MFFSLPLSEASDILGVSSSVLNKICNENGLERWPHRKYLAGKSIEEIKMEAAREKRKAQTDKQRNAATTAGAISTSTISPMVSKTIRPGSEVSKSQASPQRAGIKDAYTWRPQHLYSPGLASETSLSSDEFKYGFPSVGLSVYTKKWWGSGTLDDGSINSEADPEIPGEEKKHSDEQQEGALSKQGDNSGTEVEEGGSDAIGAVSLSALRKRAVEEGREALKLGIWRDYGIDKLGKKDQMLLRRLFQKG